MKQENRIQTAEMRILRAIIGKTRRDRIRNEIVREEVGIKSILDKMDAARLRWWGHLEKMPEESLPKKRWRWRPEGKRPRGPPR